MQQHIVELVKWKAKPGVTDHQMVAAVDGILPDLKILPGFICQSLYKDDDGVWVDIYQWETRAEAEASNDAMADRQAFGVLMALVVPSSIAIEFLTLPG
ncbi:hypothetical protein ACFQDZ_19180 [Sulfitobacter pacificus]|uniref:hypothetical protein n=1 Tax=Sulfitobacter pacificus TaxID=1499314 RepID=UPI003609C31F